jgi:hypothetical protein
MTEDYPNCTCIGCRTNPAYEKARKRYRKEKAELFGLLAMPQTQLSLAEKERERYLKQKLRMI